MDKNELEIEILKLKHQFQIEKIRASLTMITVGVLSFIGTFIWYAERLIFGISLSFVIIIGSLFFYSKTKKNLANIVKEIRNISPRK